MTDAELSIKYLNELKEEYIDGEGFDRHPLPEYFAIEDGVEALHKFLEQESCGACCGGNQEEKAKLCQKSYLMGMEHKADQQPCEKAISQKSVLEVLRDITYSREFCIEHNIDWSLSLAVAELVINRLPSVTPIRHKGHWIPLGNYDDWGNESSYKCSECGDKNTYPDNFCPNCGSDMRGEKE